MNAIYALYPDPASAQDAFDALRHAGSGLGVDADKIVVVTAEPFEGYDFEVEQDKTYMFPLAAIGGIIGGVLGYWLASSTQTSYPLVTGGMPVVTSWTNGIIIYELTMLGAILTTLVTLLVTAGLPNYKPKLSDPEIWSGKILVGVTDPPPAARAELEAKLLQAGAAAVKEFPATASA
jgi:Alternative complex III, ActD subunit